MEFPDLVRMMIRADLETAGIAEGDVVQIELTRRPDRGLDLEGLPTFEDEDPRASLRHDRYLYG